MAPGMTCYSTLLKPFTSVRLLPLLPEIDEREVWIPAHTGNENTRVSRWRSVFIEDLFDFMFMINFDSKSATCSHIYALNVSDREFEIHEKLWVFLAQPKVYVEYKSTANSWNKSTRKSHTRINFMEELFQVMLIIGFDRRSANVNRINEADDKDFLPKH